MEKKEVCLSRWQAETNMNWLGALAVMCYAKSISDKFPLVDCLPPVWAPHPHISFAHFNRQQLHLAANESTVGDNSLTFNLNHRELCVFFLIAFVSYFNFFSFCFCFFSFVLLPYFNLLKFTFASFSKNIYSRDWF